MKVGIGTEVHIYEPGRPCEVHHVDMIACFVSTRRVAVYLENGCMLNNLTLRHYHLAADCRYRPVKVNLTGAVEKQTWSVMPSSGRGDPYEVAMWGGADGKIHWSCNCTAGTYQKLCKHVKQKSREVFGFETTDLVMAHE